MSCVEWDAQNHISKQLHSSQRMIPRNTILNIHVAEKSVLVEVGAAHEKCEL